MNTNVSFREYVHGYFARLVCGYARALDDSGVRGWINGHFNASDAGGCSDLTTRIFPALCAYLADPSRPRVLRWRGYQANVEDLVRSVFQNMFDPASPGYYGKEGLPAIDQRTVESSMLAYGAWLLRDTLLPTLPEAARQRFADWLAYFGREAHPNNWQLFLIVNQAVRQALGWPHDPAVIDTGWERINAFERADGWLTDGPEAHFDDYNWWVFGTHELWWVELTNRTSPLAQRILARTRRRLEDFPYFFAADGSYAEFGRSLTYKFGRLGCAVHAAKLGMWPHSAGMLQRLVRRHLAWYDNHGGIDRATDLVRQELTAHGSPDIREPYINTGHPYWCMHAFVALWQLPTDHPLWSAAEEPLPVEAADFTHTVAPAGWLLAGVHKGGHVLRYALGSRHGKTVYAPMAAKYAKFTYGSHFPFNVGTVEGDPAHDAALCLTDGTHWAHPEVYDRFAISNTHLRAAYTVAVGGHLVPVETILIPRGETCVRIHRLHAPAGGLRAVEGACALGYGSAVAVHKRVDAATSSASAAGRTSAIRAVGGYSRAAMPAAFRGNERINAVFDRAIIPALEADLPAAPHLLVSVAVASLSGEIAWPRIAAEWQPDGTVRVMWDSEAISVAPLSPGAG